jgi:Tfp pilus assembly ATPase PilU
MISLDDSLYELAAEGKISAGDAVSRAEDPDTLFARLEQTGGRF